MPTVYHFSLTSGLSCWQHLRTAESDAEAHQLAREWAREHLSAAGHTRGTLDVSRVAEPLPGPLPGVDYIALRAAPALCADVLNAA